MSNDDDLIRRGDVIAVLSVASRTAQKTIDAIAALPAAQVKVKQLVWRRDNLKGSYPARFRAEMPCKSGDYTLAGSERENLWQWFRNGYFAVGHQMHKPMPLEAAKAAAQADFEARILAVLESAPHVNETPKSEHGSADVLTAMPATVALVDALQVPEVRALIGLIPEVIASLDATRCNVSLTSDLCAALRAINEDKA